MRQIFILLLLFGISLPNLAQNFAPIGAEWHYDERFPFSGDIDYIKFHSEKDTLILGETCRKITKRHQVMCNMRPENEYLFDRNDTVFFFDTTFNTFQVLYNFNAQVNESWMIHTKDETGEHDFLLIEVDSVSNLNINQVDLKVLHVTYYFFDEWSPHSYTSRIIERIGDIQYMFNWQPWSMVVCDGNYSNGLRCYQDSTIGFYSTGIADSCEYTFIWTGINKKKNENIISIFPNPTLGEITIESSKKTTLNYKLTELTGKTILQNEFSESIKIDISEFTKGIYLISVYEKGNLIDSQKIMKK